MNDWQVGAPHSEPLGDHDVELTNSTLSGKKVALLVTGGIAAYRAPDVARALRKLGADVTAFVSQDGARYVAVEALEWACNKPVVTQLSFRAEHLSDASPFDAYLVAPATYNLINSLRHGVASSPILSILAAALGRMERGECQILIAPTLHGKMHNSILQESLLHLRSVGVKLIAPRDAYGKHNLPTPETLAAEVSAACSRSPLRNKRFLITAGSIPTWIDEVRVMSNLFRGTLGIRIADELFLRGSDVSLVLGPASDQVPPYLRTSIVNSFEEYRSLCLQQAQDFKPDFQILSAAVADYEVTEKRVGKIPSTGLARLDLQPTEKVVDLLLQQNPKSKIVSFKFQLQMNLQDLFQIAEDRLKKGHFAVVANLGDEKGPRGEQVAHLVTGKKDPVRMISKNQIAKGLVDFLETECAIHEL